MEPTAAFILASALFLGLIRIASTVERILRDRRSARLMAEAEQRRCRAGCGTGIAASSSGCCCVCQQYIEVEIAAAINPWPLLEAKAATRRPVYRSIEEEDARLLREYCRGRR